MTTPIERLSDAAHQRGLTVAVAESLTSGLLASEVGKGEGAGDWFCGGVVAYRMPVKTHVLGVPEDIDPASAECATALASGVRALLGADIAVSTTGVGGPDPDGGHPAGTVYLGWATANDSGAHHFQFDGPPESVLSATVAHALDALAALAEGDRTGQAGIGGRSDLSGR
ncbi:CinA family protein [Microbacterium sp. NPDC096154]|uniref:CinA family protein n=1 Tax=Microbacterium sp. NPDC096154 TaxID=3155549 RepID=UPI00331D68DE